MGCLLQGHVGTELYSVRFPVFCSFFGFFVLFFFLLKSPTALSLFYNPSIYQLTRHALKVS